MHVALRGKRRLARPVSGLIAGLIGFLAFAVTGVAADTGWVEDGSNPCTSWMGESYGLTVTVGLLCSPGQTVLTLLGSSGYSHVLYSGDTTANGGGLGGKTTVPSAGSYRLQIEVWKRVSDANDPTLLGYHGVYTYDPFTVGRGSAPTAPSATPTPIAPPAQATRAAAHSPSPTSISTARPKPSMTSRPSVAPAIASIEWAQPQPTLDPSPTVEITTQPSATPLARGWTGLGRADALPSALLGARADSATRGSASPGVFPALLVVAAVGLLFGLGLMFAIIRRKKPVPDELEQV
jgi:hypothetical protein